METPVIYLNCHDAGRLIEPYGSPIPSPHLKAFADESLLFRKAFCVAPTCSPSRAALLTGMYPHQVGMLGLAHRGFQLNDYDLHLAKRLKKVGYQTALAGQQHVISDDLVEEKIGYDAYLTRPWEWDIHNMDRLAAQAAANYIECNADRPFYLECGLFSPHRPFPELPGKTPFAPPPSYLPDTPETRADMAAYAAAMKTSDAAFGIIFDAIKRAGLWDRAIIIVTTDHGPAFPFSKCNLNDEGTGVMLMMRLPGCEGPTPCDTPVSHLDILPTILDVLGMEGDDRLEGMSLKKILNATADTPIDRDFFSEVTFHASYEPMRSIRSHRYRFTRRYDTTWATPVLPNIDDGLSKTSLLQRGLAETTLERVTLHDLFLDPLGCINRAHDPQFSSIRADLENRLRSWMERTHDPLLLGPVEQPPGTTVVPREALSFNA